jgi:hypothetical protein
MEFHSLYKFHRILKMFLEIHGKFFFSMEFRGLSIGLKMYILKYKIRNIKNINTLKFYLFNQFTFFLKIKVFYKIFYFS